MEAIERLAEALAQVQRRIAGVARHGTVAEVNPAEGWVRLDWGDGFLSAKIPYAQSAGTMRVHTPPSTGQTMTAVAPGGDLRQAVAHPLGFTAGSPSPGSEGDEFVVNVGGMTIRVTGAGIEITGEVAITGAVLTHNGKNVGSDHAHSGVMPGGGVTGPPT